MSLLSHLNLNYLRIFLVVYRTGSMTKAARELHLTQSGVSQQIKSLEETLSITLFDRINRRIVPTGEAEILYRECSRRLEDLERALSQISSEKNELRGRVRIGFPPIFGYHRVLPVLASFAQIHPGVKFDLRTGMASEITSLLIGGQLDFAFIDSFSEDTHLETEKIDVEYMELCCHRSLIKSYGIFKPEFDFFCQLPFVGYVKGEPILRAWFNSNFQKIPQNLNVVATVLDTNAVAAIILQGLGAGLLPNTIFGHGDSSLGDLHVFPVKSRVPNNIFASHFSKRTMGSAAAECFSYVKNALMN